MVKSFQNQFHVQGKQNTYKNDNSTKVVSESIVMVGIALRIAWVFNGSIFYDEFQKIFLSILLKHSHVYFIVEFILF